MEYWKQKNKRRMWETKDDRIKEERVSHLWTSTLFHRPYLLMPGKHNTALTGIMFLYIIDYNSDTISRKVREAVHIKKGSDLMNRGSGLEISQLSFPSLILSFFVSQYHSYSTISIAYISCPEEGLCEESETLTISVVSFYSGLNNKYLVHLVCPENQEEVSSNLHAKCCIYSYIMLS